MRWRRGVVVASVAVLAGCGAAAGTKPAPAVALTGSWSTYGGDPQRSGDARSAPPASALTARWKATVDGNVYAEPLVAGGMVVVATEHDTVTALDEATGAVRWSRHVGTPVDGSTLPCGNIDPSGITSTPVIDPATSTLWVVAFEAGPSHHLIGLDVATGKPTSDRVVDPPGLSPLVEQQRGALLLTGGQVLVPYGGLDGDCGAYKGAVVAASTAGAEPTSFVVPTAREGGIWAPPGPVLGASGRALVATGNADSRSVYDDANAVVALTVPQLTVASLYAPANWQELSAADLDLSSTSPAVLGDGRVVAAGKQGEAYLLPGGDLGGVGHQLAEVTACEGSGAYGGMATAGANVYVPCRNGLRQLTAGAGTLTAGWQAHVAAPGTPVVAGGAVFDLARSGELDELDPATGAVESKLTLPEAVTSFPALSEADGMLFAGTGTTVTAVRGA